MLDAKSGLRVMEQQCAGSLSRLHRDGQKFFRRYVLLMVDYHERQNNMPPLSCTGRMTNAVRRLLMSEF